MSQPFSSMNKDNHPEPEQPDNGRASKNLQVTLGPACGSCLQSLVEYPIGVIKATSERINNDFGFKMLSKGTKTNISYWFVDGLSYPTLIEVAINMFSMLTSSAALERSFSAIRFVHSADKVQKLAFIKNNAP